MFSSALRPTPPARRRLAVASALVLLSLLPHGRADAATGLIDVSYGTAGSTVTTFSGQNASLGHAFGQGDKTVVFGSIANGSWNDNIGAGRYTSAGALDPTFGTNGVTQVSLGSSQIPGQVAALPSGGFVASARVGSTSSSWKTMLVALSAEGQVDADFGADGIVDATNLGFPAMVAQPGDALVVSGNNGKTVRYTAAGELDPTFGVAGQATLGLTAASLYFTDSMLLAAGATGDGLDVAVERRTADGLLDATFGDGGRAVLSLGAEDHLEASALDADGGLLLVGWTGAVVQPGQATPPRDRWVARITSGGARDEDFAGDGLLELGPATGVTAIAAEAAGFLVSYGDWQVSSILRFSADGTPVRSFGCLGTMGLDLSPGQGERIRSLHVQGDRLLAAGSATKGTSPIPQTGGGGGATLVPLAGWSLTALDLTERQAGCGYAVDGWGGLHPVSTAGLSRPPVAQGGGYWPGWDIARGVAATETGGYVLDGWGGLHPFSAGALDTPPAAQGPYWPGWDIARGVAVLADGTGGYEVDGWGGLHAFGIGGEAAPPRAFGPYWVGWDIARDIALLPDGTGGYVVDGWGGLHPFGIGEHAPPPRPVDGPYWTGWDIVRGITVLPDGSGGYVTDGWGGTHAFTIGDGPRPPRLDGPYWSGWDIERGVALMP